MKGILQKELSGKSSKLDVMSAQGISTLMQSGFSLQEAMRILESKENAAVFTVIRSHLEKGESAAEFMKELMPDAYALYFSGFIAYLPFADALEISIRIADEQGKKKKELVKGLLYPLVLLAGVLAGTLLFSLTILPRMIELMEGFRVDASSTAVMRNVLVISVIAVTVLFLLFLSAAVYLMRPARVRKTYAYLAGKLPDSLPVQYASAQFIRFFREYMRCASSTREGLLILKGLQSQPLVSHIAGELDRQLLEGTSFEKAVDTPLIEKKLTRFFRTAVYSSDCVRMLDGYLAMCDERTDAQIRRFSRIVQIFSYSLIGITVILAYKVLLIPMTVIQSL